MLSKQIQKRAFSIPVVSPAAQAKAKSAESLKKLA